MNILNSVLGDASGGRWAVVRDYGRILQEHGHAVTLLLSRRRHAPEMAEIPAGVAVEFTDCRGHYDYFAAWNIRRRFRPPPALAIAHCSRSVALLKRALPRTPLLAVSHSNKVKRLLPADACLALNQHICDSFRQAGRGKPCFLVPNMIAITSHQSPQPRQRHQPVRIGALGRFDPVKGFDLYLQALGKLKQSGQRFIAVLGGTGSEERRLKRMAEALGLDADLTFTGWVTDVDGFLKSLDMLCVPARSDAFGLTSLQAARAGVPLVMSEAFGHLQTFTPEKEALFAALDNADGLARQMGRLIDDPELAERLRQAAFQRLLSSYSEEVVSEQIFNAIEMTIKNTKI